MLVAGRYLMVWVLPGDSVVLVELELLVRIVPFEEHD
jgi:hypothetical protein